ncbi:ABC transporter ATP-binding protein [Pseudomonas schmalbachii]|uniref:ABC transporter ATP-binding protein n=1 Tax=Pseudomonas schmalbachii TaxID=2816993 RepID=A0ABS3TZV9_9PSED|nr:ABC transporter ATP-binding protein [Pseudomonas schmalbachii]MBO3278205.1 ABC transporter ATP-binding protein [Pseudomonas schmalbachii]
MSRLEARQLAIGYPGRLLGQGMDLHLERGEVLCLLGPNGSGKSTLFKTLLGLLAPRAGTVLLDGRPLPQWSRRTLAGRIGYVPQAQDRGFPFSVEEMVLLGRSAHLGAFSSPSPHDRDVAHACLERLGIVHLRQRIYTTLSGGEQQLVLISRALAQEPSLLVLDEPTASLDFGNQIRVLEHIQALRGQGLGILLCTHQPEHALRVADRIALFKQGGLFHCGDALSVERLAWLYDLPAQQIRTQLQLFSGLIRGSGHEPG